jgi:chitinase
VQELLALFGSATPDTQSPVVAITYPSDGEMFPVGANFDITADATDDKQVTSVELFVDGVAQGSDAQSPYSWAVAGIPEGTYEFQAIAHDAAGNSTSSAIVTITVGAGGGSTAGPGTGTTGGGGGSSGGSGLTGLTGNADTGSDSGLDSGAYTTGGGALPPGFGSTAGDQEGCACRTSPLRPTAGFVFLVAAAGMMLTTRRRPRGTGLNGVLDT